MFASTRPRSLQLPQLTSLRFFAALFVVLYHSQELAGPLRPHLQRFFGFGFSAVSFFFVLSGFILTFIYAQESKPISVKLFWAKRFARIYPLFFLGLLWDSPRVIHYFFSQNNAGTAMAKIITALGANVLMVQSWIPRLASTWNTPGWSLSVEVFFYALFPFLMKGVSQMSFARTRLILSLCFALSLILIAPFVFLEQMSSLHPSLLIFAKMNPVLHLPEFLFGMALARLALLQDSGKLRRAFETWGFLGALLGLFVFMTLGPNVPLLFVHNGLFLPAFGILIFSVASGRALGSHFLARPAWVFLGNSSYAVYILHQPLKSSVLAMLEKFNTAQPPLALSIYLLALLGVSAITYWCIEEPVRTWIVQRFEARRMGQQSPPR